MRSVSIPLIAVFSIGVLPLSLEAEETVARRTDLKKEITSAYAFVPHPAATTVADTKPVWLTRSLGNDTEVAARIDPKVMILAPFEVSGGYRDQGLHEKIVKHDKDMHTQQVLGRLGIATHEMKFRKVSLYATTIFWIPIAGGMSW